MVIHWFKKRLNPDDLNEKRPLCGGLFIKAQIWYLNFYLSVLLPSPILKPLL